MESNAHNLLTDSQSGRVRYLDIAKGIAIVLVVLGHAINNITHSALFTDMENPAVIQLDILNAVIYGFHMPFFFFVAGIFADSSLRYPTGTFLKKRVVRYVIPYFAWTLIVVFIKVFTPSVQNTRVGFRDLFLSPLVPFEEYWFLYVLFFISVAYYFMMKTGNPRMKFALLVISAVLRVFSSFFPDVWIISSFSSSALYFMLGSYFDYTKQPAEMMARKAVPLTLAGTFAVLNVIYIVSGLYVSSGFLQSWYKILLALTGIGVTICLAYCLSTAETAFMRILLFCGFNSMQIYCSHQVPMGVIRLFLHRLMGTNYLWARTLIQTFATVAVCCVVFYFWPNDPYLHRVLYGEPRIRDSAASGKKGNPDS